MDYFELLTLADQDKWDTYFNELPTCQQDVYYTSNYNKLYEKLGDGTVNCFVFSDGKDFALYPFIINSVNKIGFELDQEYYDIQGVYGYNGVVSSSYAPMFVDKFYRSFRSFCSDSKIIAEFTRFHPLIKNVRFSDNNLSVSYDRKTVGISLERYNSVDELRKKSYKKEALKNIKKINTMDVNCVMTQEESDFEKFYQIYTKNMELIGAKEYYYFNKSFFLNIKTNLSKYCRLFLFYYGDELAGGFILFVCKEHSSNFLSASYPEFRKIKINEIMQDYAIKWAFKENCKQIHLGGGTTSEQDPLFKFKSKFSSEFSEFFIGKYIHNEQVYKNVVEQWQIKYPEKVCEFEKYCLKYRF